MPPLRIPITFGLYVRIGRYPVPNSQYRVFIADGGYRERKSWSDAGWAWLQQKGINEPGLWRDRRWNAPNQPVVGVTFFEAEACAAWAGGRLPSEQEWKAAARGPDVHADARALNPNAPTISTTAAMVPPKMKLL